MNTRNAWGFLSFGLVMGLLPSFAPTWFPSTGIDGSSGRAMWLQAMGVVQTAIGGGWVLWQFAVPAVVDWLAYVPPTPAAVLAFEPEATEPAFDEASTAEAA